MVLNGHEIDALRKLAVQQDTLLQGLAVERRSLMLAQLLYHGLQQPAHQQFAFNVVPQTVCRNRYAHLSDAQQIASRWAQ